MESSSMSDSKLNILETTELFPWLQNSISNEACDVMFVTSDKTLEIAEVDKDLKNDSKNNFKKKVISYSTPRWKQYEFDDYPAGCGTVAWAILYGYWHQFKGKNKIFDDLDLNIGTYVSEKYEDKTEGVGWRPYSHNGGVGSNVIMDALEDIADYCGAETGENCDGKYRLIWPYLKPGIATGIEYAREKGYKASVNYYTLAFVNCQY